MYIFRAMANIESAVIEFRKCLDSGTPTGIATIKGLLSLLSSSTATTVQELVHNLREATAQFKNIDCSTIAVRSASDLFTLFITQVGFLSSTVNIITQNLFHRRNMRGWKERTLSRVGS